MKSKRNMYASWNRCHDRLLPETWPALNPSFSLPAGAKIFTFGSCFARNIEANLATLGFDIPTRHLKMPTNEWPPGDNQFLNKYTPAAILADIESADQHLNNPDGYDPKVSEKYLVTVADDKVVDSAFPGFVPVTRERFHERRKELLELTRKAFDADCVTITLGLIETFLDHENGNYICASPNGAMIRVHPERFEFKRLSFSDSHAMVMKSIEILRSRNPDCKILITTSPIALNRTFSDDDVIIANSYSKSMLRTVCGQIAEEVPDLDYFPSFENAFMTKSWDIYEPDMLHLKKSFVSKIVSRLVEFYFADIAPASVSFQKSFALLTDRDLDGAEKEILEAIKLDPENPEILEHAGTVARMMTKTEEAISYYERAIKIAPSGSLYNILAMQLAKVTRVDDALKAIDEAIMLEPAKPTHRLQKAQILIRLKRMEDAELELDYLLAENPGNVHALIKKIDILKLQKAEDAAIMAVAATALAKVANGHKDRFRAEIARANLRLGNVAAAKQYYSAAAKGSKFFAGLGEEIENLEESQAST